MADYSCLFSWLGIFDHDGNGTIDIREFSQLWAYINQWKGVFDRYDRDRSGNIDANELFTGSTISSVETDMIKQFDLLLYRQVSLLYIFFSLSLCTHFH